MFPLRHAQHIRDDVQLLRIANVFLSKEITKSQMWPMRLPGDAVVQKARYALFEEYKMKDSDLGMLRMRQEQDAEKVAAATHVRMRQEAMQEA